MKQEFQVTYVIMRAGISPRPGNWILERSTDGKNFKAWQFFAVSDDECWTQYGILASPASPDFVSDSDVICTSHFSKLKPLEGGEVHTSLVAGRPGSNISSPDLSQFTRARYVRFRFQKINTPPDKFSQLVDNAYQKKLFYSVREIAVGAQCICNGHASRCKLNKGDYHCDCSHNTCGPRCDRCCPLHNALPWSAGTLPHGTPCQKCQCYGHATACKYDPVVHAANLSLDSEGSYSGGGVCINCTAHTTGVNCENCELGHYRPTGTPPDAEVPCIPCECNFMGTAGPCIRDDSQIHLGKFAGHCECLLGYAGQLCDRCAPGFHKFPNCEPCPCDIRGSKLYDTCAPQCECKGNVEGTRCDQCKEGYFGLKQDNPAGCQQCYCSGVSHKCSEAKNLYKHIIDTTDFWLVSDMNVNRTVVPTLDTETNLLSTGGDIPDTHAYYWLAPHQYGGNRISSYRLNLEFSVSWVVMRGDTSGIPTQVPDVILIGSNGLRLGSGTSQYHTRDNLTLSVPLQESHFYTIGSDIADITPEEEDTDYIYRGDDVSKEQFLSVLIDVKHVLLRAKYHTDQAETSLSYARLETGTTEDISGSNDLLDNIEQCVCPLGYRGLSCESCEFGYSRVVPESGGHAQCLPCDCNAHAATCDPVTGQCSACEHNTEGLKCDRCKVGYYGNALQGTSEDCTRCACPLNEASNNFSPFCEPLGPNGTEYICTQCAPGYIGDHCESCDAGYYGNPGVLGGTCIPCSCGGGPCDAISGECVQCRGNTEGARCERCKPLYYGDPRLGECKPCNCITSGSLGDECDTITGQCQCNENRAGRNCDQCAPGLGNLALDCPPCDCDPIGTLSSPQPCNPVSGQCYCQPGITGPRCDTCELGYWNFTMTGCTSCNCDHDGSLGSSCNTLTGQCSCKSNMTGLSCNQCLPGHWGLQEMECAPCDCNPVGAVNHSCDEMTGQCVCRKGVTGRTCDKCRPNYFGFSMNGCIECASCEESGMVCSKDHGQCVCPPFTQGDQCDQCAPNSYGYAPRLGCQMCRCDPRGSMRAQCDNITGDCVCRPGYMGAQCNQCAPEYYGYPSCRPCDCNQAGSISSLCDNEGQCDCKSNVQGLQCDQCRAGSFSLSLDNPEGCTSCFCFNRSTHCTEAGITWSQVRLTHPRTLVINYDNTSTSGLTSAEQLYPVDTHEICYVYLALPDGNVMKNQHKTRMNITNNLRIIPGDSEDVEIGVNFMYFDYPVYWSLPRQFLGDKIMSYGGFMRFVVETEGGTSVLPGAVLSSYPMVQIQGNDKLVLEYYPVIETEGNRHSVRFHETLWRMKNNPLDPVSRQTLMLTLQNLQHVFIRATDSVDFTRATLKDISMECGTFLPPQNLSLLRQATVPGIEMCACPSPYAASSCQNPSIGWFRHRSHYTSHATIVIQLVGEAKPCQCNNRSSVCDVETGRCLECSDNTGGPHCEVCAEGYYGVPPSEGGTCRPCPCPSVYQNFAHSCIVSPGHETQCFCQQGYTGPLCDRCAYGYFGFPSEPNGSCSPCNCSPYGSVSDECHEESGQCNCRLGITGRDCSQCEPRHILTSRGCASCQDGCTNLLLDKVIELDVLYKRGSHHILNGLLSPPWAPLLAINSNCSVLEETLQLWLEMDERIQGLPQQVEEELVRRAAHHAEQSAKLFHTSNDTALAAKHIRLNSEHLLNTVLSNITWLEGLVDELLSYLGEDAALVNVSLSLERARELQTFIMESDLEALGNFARKTLDECTDILYHVKDRMSNHLNTEHIHRSIDTLLDRIRDMNSKIQAILMSNTNTRRLTESNKARLSGLEERVRQIDSMEEEVSSVANQSDVMIAMSQVDVDEAGDDLEELDELSAELNNLALSIEEEEGILFNLNPQYRNRFVEPATKHATKLMAEAERYAGLFNATRRDADIAVKASRAYQTIIDELSAARIGAIDASRAAEEAYAQARPGTDSLVDQSISAEEKSRVLKTISESQLMKVTELQLLLNTQKNYVQNLTNVVRGINKEESNIVKSVQDMLNSSGDNMSHQDILEGTAGNVSSKMSRLNQLAYDHLDVSDRLFEQAAMLREQSQTELRPQLKLLSMEGAKNLNVTNDKISEALLTSKKVTDTFYLLKSSAMKYSQVFSQWNATTSNDLATLRAKIQEARHLAEGVRLSLTSKKETGSCVRSYQPSHLEPTTRNDIVLTYAISSQHRDALLFYLPSKTTEDYIAVEMVNRKIRFLWNLGGEPGEVTHPMHIQTAGDLSNDQHWYKIEAQRISNVGYLLVRPVVLPLGSPLVNALPLTNSSTPGIGRFDVGPSDRAWIGGADYKPPQFLSRVSGLVGCLHQVALDGRPLGLWNFRSQTDSCDVCIEGAEETGLGQDEQAYRFSGDGYALLYHETVSTYNKYLFTVSLSFRTFDEDALVLLAITHQQDRHVSLVLSQGHVVFRIKYGGEASLEIATTGRYNTGNWTRLEATRYFDRKRKIERGILKVEAESRDGAPTPPPSQDDIPDLLRAAYYLGGVSPSFSSPLDLPPSFLGCMANINVAQEGYSPTRGQYWGVQPGCSNKPVTVVGFSGDGYLELPSHSLKKKATFGFMFATHQEDALLMLSTLEGFGTYGDTVEDNEELTNVIDLESRQSYYSVSLRRGQLDIRVNAGRGEVRLASDSSEYNDGAFHSILVSKQGKRLELRVNDVVHALATLPDGSSVVRAPGRWGGLFFGGLPQGINTTGRAVSDVPLVGTIKDAIFNDELIHFDSPVEFEHARIGRSGLLPQVTGQDSYEAPRMTTKEDLTGCRKVSGYTMEAGAVKFGDKKHSHVQITHRKRNVFQKMFTIELTFRSFYNNGLVFIVPGNKGKQSHYLMTSLRNGRLSVVLKTRAKVEVMSQAVLNDGHWHTLRIEKADKELSVHVDSILAATSKAPRRLSIGNVMYVGGLPEQAVEFPETVVQKTETLKGCVQKLAVNGQAEDLVGDSAIHYNVGQCFPLVERGSYFPGDAYALYRNQFNIGDLTDLELEFRTSELTGILLSVSEPEGYPALSLELNQGKIILSGDMGDRRTFSISHSFTSKYSGCDNRWHHIHLAIVHDEFTLRVDGTDHKYFLSDNGHFTSARTSSPLFIGGLPDGAAIGALETRENFKGCIRNIVIGGEKSEWSMMTYLHNILLTSCPVV
uniref:Laminin subunit alpha-1 n=1 Tax=Cacopsylla melanoneura TaxID=428564 RepID=A0A8D8X2U9_9HEMI